jgi:hypothetical protein
MEKLKTPIADFLIKLSTSIEEHLKFEEDKYKYLEKYDFDDRIKEILINGDRVEIKKELYKEQNLEIELPSMYTMGKVEIAKILEEEN